MTQPRSTLVSLDATPYYHCISRCVRRAWLCGQDPLTGRSFDHRKAWLVERLTFLGTVFAIDIAAYAVMSNHYHLVLHVDAARAASWSEEEVVRRWTRLCRGPDLAQRYLQGDALSEAERQWLAPRIETWRHRLFSLSWFMARLNQTISVRANREEGCKGRFWEGRFTSQALLDEVALLGCMAYVDLNPVRAGITDTLETSDFTSVQDRIRQRHGPTGSRATPQLMPFGESLPPPSPLAGLPYALPDYLELVEWTGRAIREDKKGFLQAVPPTLLGTLKVSEQQWRGLVREIRKNAGRRLHGLNKLKAIERRARTMLAA